MVAILLKTVLLILRIFEFPDFIYSSSIRYSDVESPIFDRHEEFLFNRQQTILRADNLTLGHSLPLTEKELLVNEILMGFKEQEFELGLKSHGKHFPAAHHFFHSKEEIDTSSVFQIIKLLPKGAALHLHLDLSVSLEFLVKTLTKRKDLYYCVGSRNNLLFRFSDKCPKGSSCNNCKNRPSASTHDFKHNEFLDQWFHKKMSMFTNQPEVDYPSSEQAWEEFEDKVDAVVGLTYYEKAAKDTLYQVLLEFYWDNVFYIEPRVTLKGHYYLNQTELTSSEILKLSIDTVKRFQKNFPDFWGAKFIYAPQRTSTPEQVADYLEEALRLQALYPEHFAGFDLVGEEDLGHPLKDFLPLLIEAGSKGLKYFFHAGETLWHGTDVDRNLVDALLLNTSRVAHAYALKYYPTLMDLVKKREIAVEVCPVSSQVLEYAPDLRTHPSKEYFTNGFPVVVGGDDNGIWEALPLSHDWYYAFMALGGRQADLRFLKELALNSIKYSAANSREKELWLRKWSLKWDQFLDQVILEFNVNS